MSVWDCYGMGEGSVVFYWLIGYMLIVEALD